MREALARLDQRIDAPLQLIVGGGGAMITAEPTDDGWVDVDVHPTDATQGVAVPRLTVRLEDIVEALPTTTRT